MTETRSLALHRPEYLWCTLCPEMDTMAGPPVICRPGRRRGTQCPQMAILRGPWRRLILVTMCAPVVRGVTEALCCDGQAAGSRYGRVMSFMRRHG